MEAIFKGFLGHFGPISEVWRPFWPVLRDFEPFWASFCLFWGHFRSMCGIWRPFWPVFRGFWGHLGSISGVRRPFLAHLNSTEAIFGLSEGSEAILILSERFGGHFGLSEGGLLSLSEGVPFGAYPFLGPFGLF